MKNKYEWGTIPGHRIGLLHKWTIGMRKTYSLPILSWISPCGLKYSKMNINPDPDFRTKGIKCKKCQNRTHYKKKD